VNVTDMKMIVGVHYFNWHNHRDDCRKFVKINTGKLDMVHMVCFVAVQATLETIVNTRPTPAAACRVYSVIVSQIRRLRTNAFVL